MDNLLISFCEQFVPEIRHILRRRLGGADIRVLRLAFVKFFLSQIDIFLKGFSIDHKRHRKHEDSQFTCLRLGNAAVAVRNNCNFHVVLLPRGI